jgi:hypothetical protein
MFSKIQSWICGKLILTNCVSIKRSYRLGARNLNYSLTIGRNAARRRLTFRPKPILHPIPPIDEDFALIYILLKPCGYYKRRFMSYDVAIIFCKHTYHPFCLVHNAKRIINIMCVNSCFIHNGGLLKASENQMSK